jgi:hypothetical protein
MTASDVGNRGSLEDDVSVVETRLPLPTRRRVDIIQLKQAATAKAGTSCGDCNLVGGFAPEGADLQSAKNRPPVDSSPRGVKPTREIGGTKRRVSGEALGEFAALLGPIRHGASSVTQLSRREELEKPKEQLQQRKRRRHES